MLGKKQRLMKRFQTEMLYLTRTRAARLKRDVVYLNSHNSYEHELKKTQVALEQMKLGRQIITEAMRKSDGRIVDVVCLDTGEEFEIVCKNDDKETLDRYKKEGVTIIRTGGESNV